VSGRVQGGIITNLFASGIKDKLPEAVCEPEIAKIREFLSQNGCVESDKLKAMTVKSVVDSLCSNIR
jgi:hypothetical protein